MNIVRELNPRGRLTTHMTFGLFEAYLVALFPASSRITKFIHCNFGSMLVYRRVESHDFSQPKSV